MQTHLYSAYCIDKERGAELCSRDVACAHIPDKAFSVYKREEVMSIPSKERRYEGGYDAVVGYYCPWTRT